MVSVACTTCGTINDSEDAFCSECGEKIAKESSTSVEKFIENNGNQINYILHRSNLSKVASTFSLKNDDRLLYRIETPNMFKYFLRSFLFTASIFPIILIMMLSYTILPLKGTFFFILEFFVIPFIFLIFVTVSSVGRSLKYKVFSENNDEKGLIKADTKLFNLKSTLLGKNWKFTTTDNTMELLFKFSSRYEGTITANQKSYTISITRDKQNKQFYRGLSKIEAYNEQGTSIISIDLPEKTSRRRIPPSVLEISANDSINELVVVFFVVVAVAKYFILAR